MKRILFVCLGNICRSSSAEEVMRTLIKKEGLEHEIEVDSAGILSYHRGELPDSRMRMHASRRGYNLTHRSRPVCTEDFYHFEGNAQALRLVSKLHFLVDENGMNLTYALLNTIIKYPVASTQIRPKSGDIREKKMGYYYADRELFEDIVMETGAEIADIL